MELFSEKSPIIFVYELYFTSTQKIVKVTLIKTDPPPLPHPHPYLLHAIQVKH